MKMLDTSGHGTAPLRSRPARPLIDRTFDRKSLSGDTTVALSRTVLLLRLLHSWILYDTVIVIVLFKLCHIVCTLCDITRH